MPNITCKISVSGWGNLATLFAAEVAGYQAGVARSLTVINNNAAVAYLHFTDSGTQPATADEGAPLSNAAASAPGMAFTAENVDLNTTWINTPAAQDIRFIAKG